MDPNQFKSKYSIVIAGDNFDYGSSAKDARWRGGEVLAVVASLRQIFFRNFGGSGEMYPLQAEVRSREECRTRHVVSIVLGGNKLVNHLLKRVSDKQLGMLGRLLRPVGFSPMRGKLG
ncbi:3-isopropylmalate dehydratase small subunit 1 [Camellia lanceoleosa]|uniref:3-isopropylmalate dehydratase small subunit 1 n=1 Tax=Camellia lanceoleosa TaxID=1840588 RepID=A0ACC0GI56_9ERIC|nr:3-isopropylmalate dehydratase small subunit 1 [Camellia lanceoleosa]